MADYSKTSPNESQRLVIQRMLDSMDIAKPCIIKEVKPGPPLKVTIQPTERMKITIGQETKYMALPEINDVPVILPCAQTAGFLLTLPLKPGDTGLLIVADKDITNFVASGNINDPPVGSDPDVSNVRKRSLTDVIFIPGLSSDQVAIQSYNTENIELRDLTRTSYISLGPDGITMTDGQAVYSMKGGSVTTTAPGTVNTQADGAISMSTSSTCTISSSNMELSGSGNTIQGNITQRDGTFTDGNGKNSSSHRHTGVESGSDTSGPVA